MKRVFQWRRYLDWKNLSSQEKVSVKRLLFVPVVAYFVIAFIHHYAFSLIFLIGGFLAYKKFEKGQLKK
tara:strand:- start:113 stop:319 length:207 start_codon:yes stop_codon:yes gene_type:complete